MPEISDERLKELELAAERSRDLEASKKRLEEESTKYKKRALDAEGKLSDAEKAKLEADGKTQELLDKERAERLSIEEKWKTSRKKALQEKLRAEASKYAKDAHNVDMVLKVNSHRDLLKIDEESETIEGVEEFIGKVRESDPYLFGKKKLPEGGGTNLPPNHKGDEDDFKSEDEKYLSELRSCNTRSEITAVKKKYGKSLEY